MPRSHFLFATFAALLTLLPGNTARANGILVLGQDRRVHSSVLISDGVDSDADSEHLVAPDSGPFVEDSNVFVSLPTAAADASGSQNSIFLQHAIHALGGYAALGDIPATEGFAYANGNSAVAIRFQLQTASTYVFQGFVDTFGEGSVTTGLSRPFQTVEWFSSQGDTHVDFNESGILEPGIYDLNINAAGTLNLEPGSTGNISGGYEVNLVFGSATDAPVVVASSFGAFPNPFSNETRITLPENVGSARIVDLAGRVVRTISGEGVLVWDGRDENGQSMANGVYWAAPVSASVPATPLKLVRVR